MDERQHSDDHLPEVVPIVTSRALSRSPYGSYEYYERQPLAPASEYRQYPGSPHLRSQQSPRLSPARASSPPVGSILPYHVADKYRPTSPSATTGYSKYGDDSEKEVSQSIYQAIPSGHPEQVQQPAQSQQKKKKIFGLPKRWCLVLTAIAVCAIIAIAVALGGFFGTKHSPPTHSSAPTSTGDPNYSIGGDLDPLYYSKTGAFNGSGIAIASVNFGQDASIFVYFQHYTGEIRSSILEADGTWKNSSVVAGNARNGTPLSAVAYIIDEVANWHIFYIDDNEHVCQRTSTNASFGQGIIWQDGPLNDLNLKANHADMIGLQACYWGNFYGDTDFTYSDGFNATNENSTLAPTGMHLWYADSDTSFKQYSWYNGANDWSNDNQTWHNMNGRAGVGCQTWESGTVSYVFMVDIQNTLEIWWKDSNSSNESPTHLTNQWVNSSVAIPNVHPSSSLGYTDYLVFQSADESIQGYNISWAAENTIIAAAWLDGTTGYDNWTISSVSGASVSGVPGTHLGVTSLADQSGGAHMAVFFQTLGDDVTMYSRDNTGGGWTYAQAPVK